MSRAILVLALILGSLPLYAHGADSDPEHGWTTTNAGPELIRYFTHEKFPCYASARNLLGCMEMINELGRRTHPAQGFVEEDGKLALIPVNPHPSHPMSSDEYEKLQLQTLTPAAEAIFSTHEHPIDFDRTAEQLLHELPRTISVQRATGNAINFLVKVQDWRSHIDPIEALLDESEDAPSNVEIRTVDDFGSTDLYVKIQSFDDLNACEKIRKAILSHGNIHGIIIDLRRNFGGLVNQVTCIGGLFVGKRPILRERLVFNGKVSDKIRMDLGTSEQVTDKPLVVLINHWSASASEIFAGAMQDYGRAWIVGDRSYGKGTVQQGAELAIDPSIWYFQTEAVYELPSGRSIQGDGIHPDFEVHESDAKKSSEREEDFLPYVLPFTGKKWAEARPIEVEAVNNCLSSSDEAPVTRGKPDAQLLRAEQVSRCSNPELVH